MITTGPDPDVVDIVTMSGGIDFAAASNVNDAVSITSAGTVNLDIPGGNLQTGSANVHAAGSITGSGGLKSTAAAGVILVSTSGGLGSDGQHLAVFIDGNGKLVATTSNVDQFLSTPGTISLDTIDAGNGSAAFRRHLHPYRQ